VGVDERCIGCERPVGVGTRAFPARRPQGDRFLCEDCASVVSAGRAETESGNRVLERIRQYGLGMSGGRTGGVGGPG
jgi:hypothetical protein